MTADESTKWCVSWLAMSMMGIIGLAGLIVAVDHIKPQHAPDETTITVLPSSSDLHVKTVVGEPVKVGSVTLIPIMVTDSTELPYEMTMYVVEDTSLNKFYVIVPRPESRPEESTKNESR